MYHVMMKNTILLTIRVKSIEIDTMYYLGSPCVVCYMYVIVRYGNHRYTSIVVEAFYSSDMGSRLTLTEAGPKPWVTINLLLANILIMH